MKYGLNKSKRGGVEELYEDVGAGDIINAYGSAQITGYYGDLISKERNDGIEFFSEIETKTSFYY